MNCAPMNLPMWVCLNMHLLELISFVDLHVCETYYLLRQDYMQMLHRDVHRRFDPEGRSEDRP